MSIVLSNNLTSSLPSIPENKVGLSVDHVTYDLVAKNDLQVIKIITLAQPKYTISNSVVNENTDTFKFLGNVFLPGGTLSNSSVAFFGSYTGTGTTILQLIDEESTVFATWTVTGSVQTQVLPGDVGITEGWHSVRIKNDVGISIFKSVTLIFN